MLSEYRIIPNVCKIAVLRANGLGDFIFALPALQALRNAYPQAEIVLLANDWHAAFLKDRPGPINRVIVIPPVKGVGVDPDDSHRIEDPAEQGRFFANMRCEHFDLAIQMHGGGRHSNPFLLRLGACMTIGLKTPDAAPLDRWVPYVYFQPEIVRYLEVVSLVGARVVTLEPHIAIVENDLAEVQRIVPDKGKPLVALHPGASDPGRCWPEKKFAALGDALAAAGTQIVITGTQAENHLVEAVIGSIKTETKSPYGGLSLGGLAGLF